MAVWRSSGVISFLDELKKNVALLSLPVKLINVSLFSVAEPSTMIKKMTPMKIWIQKSNFFVFSCNCILSPVEALDDTKMLNIATDNMKHS